MDGKQSLKNMGETEFFDRMGEISNRKRRERLESLGLGFLLETRRVQIQCPHRTDLKPTSPNAEPTLPPFDPDFFPDYPANVEAADARGLSYDPGSGAYVDPDGCLILDGFGQVIG